MNVIFEYMWGRAWPGVILLLLFMAPLVACGGPAPLQFTPIDLGLPNEALHAPVAGPVPDATRFHVGITFKIDQGLLDKMNSQKLQPGQHSHLEDLADKIGISNATYQQIKDFFNLSDIRLKLSKLHTHLTIDASAKTFAKLLQTHFSYHSLNGRKFYEPDTPPKLPKFLVDSLVAITGLDNYSSPPQPGAYLQQVAPPMAHRRAAQDCNPKSQTLFPREVAHAYGYDQLWNRGWHGENMTVNLVEIDGFDQGDIENYFACINFRGKLDVVDIDSVPNQALGESTLDIEMVAGLARSVHIVDYETNGNADGDVWTQINDELQQIINDNTDNANAGSAVSISLGVAEREIDAADRNAIDQSLQILTKAEHMTVFIASGDCGAFTDRRFGSRSVSFPASDPWVAAVGGTILSVDGDGNRVLESVWSDGSNRFSCKNRWGSGGGNSEIFRRPGWQDASAVNNQYSRGMRQIPDISAVAYALAVYFDGRWDAVGGTSAAAPIWAAGEVLMNQGLIQQIHKFAYSPQQFYLAANRTIGRHPYYDVTRGDNLYYPATPGWDYATGLGTPNLADYYQVMYQDIR